MAATAEVRREAGGLFFSASMGSAIGRRPAGSAGGTGGYDVRWNATDKRLEKSADGGATWTTVLEFAAYDA